MCGGVGCGAIAGTNGASDCCSATIAATGQLCGTAPCVMNNGTFTPSPVALPTALPTMEGATIAPTAGSRDFAFTTAPTSAGTAAPAHGFKTEMPSQSPAILPPDLEISAAPTLAGDVNGEFTRILLLRSSGVGHFGSSILSCVLEDDDGMVAKFGMTGTSCAWMGCTWLSCARVCLLGGGAATARMPHSVLCVGTSRAVTMNILKLNLLQLLDIQVSMLVLNSERFRCGVGNGIIDT